MNEATDDLLLKLSKESDLFQKAELRENLSEIVNHLLLHDFNRLVSILYRVDVSEQKLKSLLQQNPDTDAAVLITELLIQRQNEKQQSKENSKTDMNIPEDEKW